MPILAATVISRLSLENRFDGALLILRALAVHDVLEFGMACHGAKASRGKVGTGFPQKRCDN
jgi:hypothetical protein